MHWVLNLLAKKYIYCVPLSIEVPYVQNARCNLVGAFMFEEKGERATMSDCA